MEQHREGDALSELVGSGGRLGSVHSLKFSKIPLLGSGNSLNDLSLSFVALNRKVGVRRGVTATQRPS